MQTKRTFVLSALTAAALGALTVSASAADAPKIAVDLTTLTSPFWTAYNQYIVNEAKAQGVDLLQPFNSEFDTAKQITGVKNAITLGANGLIFSPFDSSAAGTILKTAAAAKVAVVAVDVAPDSGPVAIVVRANNIAYGEKACKYIGEHVAEGPIVQIMGDQASINGRDRGNGFRDCITKNYPNSSSSKFRPRHGPAKTPRPVSTPFSTRRPISRRSTCTPAAFSSRRHCRR